MVKRNIEGSDYAENIAWQLVQKFVAFSYLPLPDDVHQFAVKDEAKNVIDELIRNNPSTSSPVIRG